MNTFASENSMSEDQEVPPLPSSWMERFLQHQQVMHDKHQEQFLTVFHVPLQRYWPNELQGFDIVRFEDEIVKSRERPMCEVVVEKWGEVGHQILKELISGPPDDTSCDLPDKPFSRWTINDLQRAFVSNYGFSSWEEIHPVHRATYMASVKRTCQNRVNRGDRVLPSVLTALGIKPRKPKKAKKRSLKKTRAKRV